ncbi:hypothetical protein D8674_009148 [Pyrus ussuriensis x Pyrus communis]|uniref:Uncharacterized protein n=1 Tax=Pyrus ussuriensis x Pyrus communis TaxID=2448454 RepID=A0A5N5HVF3_9ROSA|nr:hypothetical protein D8674_009148 [Pyrus ussuriensis x Pyrus communis]
MSMIAFASFCWLTPEMLVASKFEVMTAGSLVDALATEITSNNRWLVFCRICGLLHFPQVGSFGWLRVRIRNRVSNLGSTLCRFNPAIPFPASYHCLFAFNILVPCISLIGCVLSFSLSFCFALVLPSLPSWTGLILPGGSSLMGIL